MTNSVFATGCVSQCLPQGCVSQCLPQGCVSQCLPQGCVSQCLPQGVCHSVCHGLPQCERHSVRHSVCHSVCYVDDIQPADYSHAVIECVERTGQQGRQCVNGTANSSDAQNSLKFKGSYTIFECLIGKSFDVEYHNLEEKKKLIHRH